MRPILRHVAVLGAALIIAAPLQAQDDGKESRKSGERVEKGDTITVKGCLSGSTLVATESEALESSGLLASGLTFRLTGKKDILKSLRDGYEGTIVSIEGELKSDLRQEQGQSRTVGRTRITIGGAMPSPNSPQAVISRRSLPVLEVESFDGSHTPCRP